MLSVKSQSYSRTLSLRCQSEFSPEILRAEPKRKQKKNERKEKKGEKGPMKRKRKEN